MVVELFMLLWFYNRRECKRLNGLNGLHYTVISLFLLPLPASLHPYHTCPSPLSLSLLLSPCFFSLCLGRELGWLCMFSNRRAYWRSRAANLPWPCFPWVKEICLTTHTHTLIDILTWKQEVYSEKLTFSKQSLILRYGMWFWANEISRWAGLRSVKSRFWTKCAVTFLKQNHFFASW